MRRRGERGQAMARRARGFSMRVIYNDAARAAEAIEREMQLEFVTKEELLREADFISLHVPLLDSTRKLIGEPELRLMKRSAILVNTARGPVVDESALAHALSERWIAGAGLDVFENEPRVHPQLLQLDNVVLAPHIASASIDTRREMSMLAVHNAVAALQGGLDVACFESRAPELTAAAWLEDVIFQDLFELWPQRHRPM